MFKYAFLLTGNKVAAKAILKNCRTEYVENMAKFGSGHANKSLRISIRKACHNWLYTEVMAKINITKNHSSYAAATTTKPSVTQNLPQ